MYFYNDLQIYAGVYGGFAIAGFVTKIIHADKTEISTHPSPKTKDFNGFMELLGDVRRAYLPGKDKARINLDINASIMA